MEVVLVLRFKEAMKPFLRFVLILLFLLGLITKIIFAQGSSAKNLNVIFELISKESSYETYLSKFSNKNRPEVVLVIPAVNYS
ncbi:MAG: hypothetical protein ACPLSN_07920, partial [Dictyoglomus turgidum]